MHIPKHTSNLSVSQEEAVDGCILRISWIYTYPQFKNNKSVVCRKKLSTSVNPAVLKNIPSSTNDDVINLHCHIASITLPSPTARLRSLEPRTCNPQSLGICKVQECNVYVYSTRAMVINT